MQVSRANIFFNAFTNTIRESIIGIQNKISQFIDYTLADLYVGYCTYWALDDTKSREIKLLTKTIGFLEKELLEHVDSGELLDSLSQLVSDWSLPDLDVQNRSLEEIAFLNGGEAALAAQDKAVKKQLLTTFKTHRCSFKSLQNGIENSGVGLKSALFRSNDVLFRAKNPPQRPVINTILAVSNGIPSTEWEQPSKPFQEFPPYLFYYGHALDSEEGDDTIRYTPKAHYNIKSPYVKAVQWAEKKLLSQPFDQLSAKELKEAFLSLKKAMVSTKENRDKSLIRSEGILVFAPGMRGTFVYHASRLKNHGDNEAAQALLNMNNRCERWGDFEKTEPYFIAQEWQAMKKIADITPKPDDIEFLLDNFCDKLEILLKNSDLHPYQIASFIQYGLVKIHPFDDTNGRLARLFMNIYLMQKGHTPILVFSDEEYTACFQEKDFEKSFCRFIHESAKEVKNCLENGKIPSVKRPGEFAGQGIGCPIQ